MNNATSDSIRVVCPRCVDTTQASRDDMECDHCGADVFERVARTEPAVGRRKRG